MAIAGRNAPDPKIPWINLQRRTQEISLLGEGNENQPSIEVTAIKV